MLTVIQVSYLKQQKQRYKSLLCSKHFKMLLHNVHAAPLHCLKSFPKLEQQKHFSATMMFCTRQAFGQIPNVYKTIAKFLISFIIGHIKALLI